MGSVSGYGLVLAESTSTLFSGTVLKKMVYNLEKAMHTVH